ncbi:hypothetical protein RND81_07G186600 [Saponaria officinalis]|uniref:Single-stranded DNA-binding protein WHY1, chloroplastic n=1 Tax=Saponaria officinalis TaxID=3572 RepID=A0AAW1JSR5_SAPOF
MVQNLLSSPSNTPIFTNPTFQTNNSSSSLTHSLNSIITVSNNFTFKKISTNCCNFSQKLGFSVKCRQSSDYFEQSTPRFSPSYSPTTSTPSSGSPPRVFVGHSIYKGKAALTIDPRAPEFVPLESGALKISREGFIMLQFAPAAGVRQYDWSRKQVFSLSVTEIGTLMSLGAKESCEFFHDPNKGKSDEGKVRKVLKVEPLPDGSGHFFNLSVQNKLVNVDESIYMPITKGEFAVLISGFNFILPYLMGWHAYANSTKPEDSTRTNNRGTGTVDYEWNR